MPHSLDPKIARLHPIHVTAEQKKEIQDRAQAARMTVAEYVRDRALGKECPSIAGREAA